MTIERGPAGGEGRRQERALRPRPPDRAASSSPGLTVVTASVSLSGLRLDAGEREAARWGPPWRPFRPPPDGRLGAPARRRWPFGPVAADLDEAERIFDRTLAAVPRARSARSSTTSGTTAASGSGPALLLLTAQALRQGHAGAPHARRRRRDDPHRDARPRRRARRGRHSAATSRPSTPAGGTRSASCSATCCSRTPST